MQILLKLLILDTLTSDNIYMKINRGYFKMQLKRNLLILTKIALGIVKVIYNIEYI